MTAEAINYYKTPVYNGLTVKQIIEAYREAIRERYGDYAADKSKCTYHAGVYRCRIGAIGNTLRTRHPEVILAGAELLRSGRLDIGGTRPPPPVEIKGRYT